MTLWLDGESTVQGATCPDCGTDYVLVKSFVVDEAGPHAIGVVSLHHHGTPEAWIDVIFGTFDEGDDVPRLTFGCRVGPVEGSDDPAATAVQAAVAFPDSKTFGHKLSRDEALTHERLPDFWSVVDFLLEHEPHVSHHVYGHRGPVRPRSRRRWFRRRA
ncbi:hypothetical protein [Aeromicrobium sp.]|uniref:hypothetical protein n=1 Tax=Aeromicrobium sp. TaxID=1871063 RepID=UPI004033DE26